MFADAKAGAELPHSKSARRGRRLLHKKNPTSSGELVGGGDAEGFHFAVEVGAFEADGVGGLRHVPAIFLELAENEFAFVGAAGFVERAVRLLGAFDDTAEKFGRKMMRL